MQHVINNITLMQHFPGTTYEYWDAMDLFQKAKVMGVLDGQNNVKKQQGH